MRLFAMYGVPDTAFSLPKQKNGNWKTVKVKPTDNDLENFIPWDEIVAIREKMGAIALQKPTNSEFYHRYMVMALYTFLPPIRGDELCSCKVVTYDTTENMKALVTAETVFTSDVPAWPAAAVALIK